MDDDGLGVTRRGDVRGNLTDSTLRKTTPSDVKMLGTATVLAPLHTGGQWVRGL